MGSTAFGVGMGAIGALVAMGPAGPVAAIGIVVGFEKLIESVENLQ